MHRDARIAGKRLGEALSVHFGGEVIAGILDNEHPSATIRLRLDIAKLVDFRQRAPIPSAAADEYRRFVDKA